MCIYIEICTCKCTCIFAYVHTHASIYIICICVKIKGENLTLIVDHNFPTYAMSVYFFRASPTDPPSTHQDGQTYRYFSLFKYTLLTKNNRHWIYNDSQDRILWQEESPIHHVSAKWHAQNDAPRCLIIRFNLHDPIGIDQPHEFQIQFIMIYNYM